MSKIIVVGGGAAGIFAAIEAADGRSEVHLYEHNEKLGKKLFITGKGRCNVTNACESREELLANIVTNARFMYSSLAAFDNHQMMAFLEEAGLSLKTERGQRVFPASDKSSDVIRALTAELDRRGVRVHLNSQVTGLWQEEERVLGIKLGREKIPADAVILATGGVSYASCGSTGDGHRMAQESGHKVTKLLPSLVPMVTSEEWVRSLQGLSLKNISLTLKQGKKEICSDFGEMMFTHFGITGPVVLSASAHMGKYLAKGPVTAILDLKPALTDQQLDARILRDFEANKNKQIRNVLPALMPQALVPVILSLAGIDPYLEIHNVSKGQRRALAEQIKGLRMTVTALRGFNEAIITQGGVSVRDVNPATMASKRVQGLYFAGELLDVDAYTGGFNLQIAWSTGYAAGRAAAEAAWESTPQPGQMINETEG